MPIAFRSMVHLASKRLMRLGIVMKLKSIIKSYWERQTESSRLIYLRGRFMGTLWHKAISTNTHINRSYTTSFVYTILLTIKACTTDFLSRPTYQHPFLFLSLSLLISSTSFSLRVINVHRYRMTNKLLPLDIHRVCVRVCTCLCNFRPFSFFYSIIFSLTYISKLTLFTWKTLKPYRWKQFFDLHSTYRDAFMLDFTITFSVFVFVIVFFFFFFLIVIVAVFLFYFFCFDNTNNNSNRRMQQFPANKLLKRKTLNTSINQPSASHIALQYVNIYVRSRWRKSKFGTATQ